MRRQRHRIQQVSKLLKKRPTRIIVPAIFHGIPSIGPPKIPIIDFHRTFLRKQRKNILAIMIVLALEQMPAIAPAHAPLESALRTQRRRGYLQTRIKRKVFIFNYKILFTFFTFYIVIFHFDFSILQYLCSITRIAIYGRELTHVIHAWDILAAIGTLPGVHLPVITDKRQSAAMALKRS